MLITIIALSSNPATPPLDKYPTAPVSRISTRQPLYSPICKCKPTLAWLPFYDQNNLRYTRILYVRSSWMHADIHVGVMWIDKNWFKAAVDIKLASSHILSFIYITHLIITYNIHSWWGHTMIWDEHPPDIHLISNMDDYSRYPRDYPNNICSTSNTDIQLDIRRIFLAASTGYYWDNPHDIGNRQNGDYPTNIRCLAGRGQMQCGCHSRQLSW